MAGYVGVVPGSAGHSLHNPVRGVSRFVWARPRRGWSSGGSGKVFEDFPGDVAFQDAGDLAHGLAFGEASGDVVAGGLVVAHPGDHDMEQRRVGLSVPTPGEPATPSNTQLDMILAGDLLLGLGFGNPAPRRGRNEWH